MIRPFVGRVTRTNKIRISYTETIEEYVYIVPVAGTHFRVYNGVDTKDGSPTYIIDSGYGNIPHNYTPRDPPLFPVTASLNLEFYLLYPGYAASWVPWTGVVLTPPFIGTLDYVGQMSPLSSGLTDSVTSGYPHGNAWARYLNNTPNLIETSFSFSDYLNFINNPPPNVSNIQIIGYY